jgi:hypothetical protein
MDVIESGSDRRSPAQWSGRIVLGLLVAVVLVVVLVNQNRHTRSKAVRTPAPSTSPASVAALVETGTSIAYQTFGDSKDFVVQVDLTNFNHTPVHVQTQTTLDDPGFVRLVAAVRHGDFVEDEPAYDNLVAENATPATLEGEEEAQLVITGRIACGATTAGDGALTLLVNGEETRPTLPTIGDDPWAEGIRAQLC